MTSRRMFLFSFAIAFSIMVCAFAALYWSMGLTPNQTVDAQKTDVPILKPGPDDSKTLFLCAKEGALEFFFLIKFNAIQNKVSVVSVPSSFFLSSADRTVSESLSYAGMLQCVSDLKQEFDIAVDYHILCDYESLGNITASFAGFSLSEIEGALPEAIKAMLLKGSEQIDSKTIINILKLAAPLIDNDPGLDFLNKTVSIMLRHNLENLRDYGSQDIRDNFSYLTSNLSVQGLSKMHRILSLLCESEEVLFDRLVLSSEKESIDQLAAILKE